MSAEERAVVTRGCPPEAKYDKAIQSRKKTKSGIMNLGCVSTLLARSDNSFFRKICFEGANL